MEILIAFIIGIAASAAVGYFIYRRQRTDATVSEQRIAFLMEQALKETRGDSEALHSTIDIVSEQQREFQSDLSQLRSGFAAALQAFSKELGRPAPSLPRQSAESLHLSIADLRRLHEKVMPPTVAHAGELRTSQIAIAGSPYNPPVGDVVLAHLDRLLADWNSNISRLISLPRREQLCFFAKFHHEFLQIHPFKDGNGAIARTLLSKQLRGLVGDSRPVVFADRERYNEALMLADAGDLSLLEDLVAQLAENPTV